MKNPDVWDTVIVGAGPAGGVAAALMAARGARVLLLEKSAWPRDKVCGGCLNASAVAILRRAGLGRAVNNAQPIHQVAWQVGAGSLCLDTPGGVAILRRDLDSAIVNEAISRGCTFMAGASAQLLPDDPDSEYRTLTFKSGIETQTIKARIVLACDGINGTFLSNEPWAKWRIARRAWMGVSTTLPDRPHRLQRGTIHMHVGQGGYVGLVRLTNGPAHLAAALDPTICRRAGGPGQLIESILGDGSCADLAHCKFKGSGALTRRRSQLGGHRVLAIGDSCGYVEPFTGEGMAWAMTAAKCAVEMLPEPAAPWPIDLPHRWKTQHAAAIGASQRWCAALKPLVHYPPATKAALAIGRAMPALAARLMPTLDGGIA